MIACDELRCIESGQGEQPVVLLHGLLGGPENWNSVMERLSDEYRFYAIQFPIDFDEGRAYAGFSSLDVLTDYVERVCDDRGLDRFIMCGNSLGGQVAMDYCLRHPGRVTELIITGSAGLFENSLSGGKIPRLTREEIRSQAGVILHDKTHVTDDLVESVYAALCDRNYRRFLIRIAKATRNRNMKEELAQIGLPTLIIWGREDRITPPFVAEEFQQGIPNSKLLFLEDCGHSPPIEQPEVFADAMHAFVQSSAGQRSAFPRKPK